MLALAASRIVMAPHAGPLDPQIGEFPAAAILRAVEIKQAKSMKMDDQTPMMADITAKAMDQVRNYVETILLKKGWERARAQELARTMTEGRWTHDYPIAAEEAKALGLPVSTDMPEEVYGLMRHLLPFAGGAARGHWVRRLHADRILFLKGATRGSPLRLVDGGRAISMRAYRTNGTVTIGLALIQRSDCPFPPWRGPEGVIIGPRRHHQIPDKDRR